MNLLPGNANTAGPNTNTGDITMRHSDDPQTTPIITTRTSKQINYTPTIFGFITTLSYDAQYNITLLRTSISQFWSVCSPASAFPQQYLPDPDSHNWGLALMMSLNELARSSGTAYKVQAVGYIIFHMKQRNGGYGNWKDGDISSAMVMSGDFVIRVEDVEYALWMMRRLVQREEEHVAELLVPRRRRRRRGGYGGGGGQQRGYNHY